MKILKHRLLRHKLEKLRKIGRIKYHPIIHKIKHEHGLSRKTLLYVKEYGPHSNVPKTIIKESIKILLLASILSSLGGLALEHIKTVFVSIIPLIILMPVLNDMIGDYGTIVSSRFTTLLHQEKLKGKWYKNPSVKKLFAQILIIALLTGMISFMASLIISAFSGYELDFTIALKIFSISLIDVALLVSILFLISTTAGVYFYKKKEDPANFLIPITTSMADFGNMVILAILITLFF